MQQSLNDRPFCSCTSRCATKACPCKMNHLACSPACHPKKTCCNKRPIGTIAETIDISGEVSPSGREDYWKVLGTTQLYGCDKACLESGAWLNDKVVFAAEQLLKQQHPHVHGLQDTVLQLTSTLEVMRNKQFVQILNRAGNHWITISTMNCSPGTVNIYDSMNLPLTKDLEITVADLLCAPGQYIVLKYVRMQYQIGANDCGLFAIASACAICNGENPAEIKFTQGHMRKHLVMAFNNAILTPFPSEQLRRRPSSIMGKKLPVYCVCRKPYDGEKMVECSTCKEWFHCSCIRLAVTNISELFWLCESCRHSETNAAN